MDVVAIGYSSHSDYFEYKFLLFEFDESLQAWNDNFCAHRKSHQRDVSVTELCDQLVC